MRISDWSSDVCSSDLTRQPPRAAATDRLRRAPALAIDARATRRKGRSISVSEDIGSDANARQDGQWDDHYWWFADGVRLHARIYPGPAAADDATPLLCDRNSTCMNSSH